MSAPRVSPTPSGPVRAGFVRLPAAALAAYVRDLLGAAQVPAADAAIVADSLVAANLRGVDSHGVQMLASYLAQLASGGVARAAASRVVSESGACLVYDGENGLGQVVADRCVDQVLRLARSHGLGFVAARNANHFGAAAYWAEKIVRAGCIGMVFCNACPAVPPWQGQKPVFGTNPFCAAVPASAPQHWLLDMATTTVALGKLGDAAYRGEETIPDWWGFVDAEGRPTIDRRSAQAGRQTPFGRYKGSGLAMLVEILTAGLSGGPMATDVGPYGQGDRPLQISHGFLAMDPVRFGRADFPQRMDHLVGLVKGAGPAPGYDEVLLAGEPEWRMAKERIKRGVPVPLALWEQFAAASRQLHVTPPDVTASGESSPA